MFQFSSTLICWLLNQSLNVHQKNSHTARGRHEHKPLNTTLLLDRFFFFFFFAVRAITCHKMMASTKSTGEPISLFVSCKRIKQQININACKFKYVCVFFLSYLALSDFFSLLGICNRWSCYETCMSLVMISVVCFFFFSHLTINTLFV